MAVQLEMTPETSREVLTCSKTTKYKQG